MSAFNAGALSWLHPRGIHLDGKIKHSGGDALHARPPRFSAWLESGGVDGSTDHRLRARH